MLGEVCEAAGAGRDAFGLAPLPERKRETAVAAWPAPEGAEEGAGAAATEDTDPVCLELTDDPALLAEFATEAMDHLQTAELGLLDLEVNPANHEALGAVFRGFHTIKGTAGFLGLTDVQGLAHLAEALLDRAREHQIRLTGGYADLALAAADMLKAMIPSPGEVATGFAQPPPDGLEALLARLRDPEASGVSEQAAPVALPPLRTGDILVLEGKSTREVVEAALAAPDAAPVGQKLVRGAAASTRDVASALRAQKQAAEGTEATVRVRTDRLDALINMVGELVIANSMLTQDGTVQAAQFQDLGRKVSQLNKVTRELQDLGMSMRMVPLRGTFEKMTRVVRDLAHKSGKQVNLVIQGEDTEIDRNVVETLGDPLLHMIRNAIDHGIEPPEDRVSAGKAPGGTVLLRAFQAAGNVVIELRDDGRGLNRAKILAKAVANGLVEEGKELSDTEVFRLTFAAGLSTAEKVTEVSGRGVGMDVVQRSIESLRGKVDISSTPGQGTTFNIRLPLTLAIMDGMLVRVGHERYIIPTVSIQQAFCATSAAVSTVTERGEMVRWRNNLVPVVRLHRLFGIPGAADEITEALLVLTAGHQGYALMVDELLGQQQIVIKSLGEELGESAGLSGSAILGDGRVGLILDMDAIGEVAHNGTREWDKGSPAGG